MVGAEMRCLAQLVHSPTGTRVRVVRGVIRRRRGQIMSTMRRWWAGVFVGVAAAASLGGATSQALANPHGRPASQYHHPGQARAAAQRVALSAERLERALSSCRSSRTETLLAHQVERRAEALAEALAHRSSPHRAAAEWGALRAQFRSLEANLDRSERWTRHEPAVARAWRTLQIDFRRLCAELDAHGWR